MDARLGIDIGGSGIKGAPVDLVSGALAADRCRIPTPQPALVEPVSRILGRIVGSFSGVTGPIGCAFPGIVISDRIYSAANLDGSWIGVDAGARFSEACGRPVVMINDADAAGLAEARFGAAAGRSGVVLVLTLGTGIGSALLHDGRLVPNTELGHLELGGEVIEKRASNRARKVQKLSFGEWTERLNEVLAHLDRLLSPDLVVIGGGISKRFDTFGPHLRSRADLVPAALRNNAGIVGAALRAAESEAAQPTRANRR
ncbi:MAG: ROK family protein [Acidimicrobiia bacterium]|nr:ROK family protein [Acidimicrobiia bacterium]